MLQRIIDTCHIVDPVKIWNKVVICQVLFACYICVNFVPHHMIENPLMITTMRCTG